MTWNDQRILIVADDDGLIAELTRLLTAHSQANLTIVHTIEQARVCSASNGFDVIVAADHVADGGGLSLAEDESGGNDTPVLIVGDQGDDRQALQAVRRGAVDVFFRPVDGVRFMQVLQRAVRIRRKRRHREQRSARLRRLSSRVLRDRRELRQRIDLICRDLVHAYRQLAEKMVAIRDESCTPE